MQRLRRCAPVAFALFLGCSSSACVWSHRVILRNNKVVAPGDVAPDLKVATRDDLVSRVRNLYNAINSFQAKIDMAPSVGSVYKGHITDIRGVHGYVLFRKPDLIHIIGLIPVVGTKEFDMVSNTSDFKVYIVSKGLFIQGANDAPAASKNTLENLRPEAFLSSMMIPPPDASETAILEDATDEENSLYILHLVRTARDGTLLLRRQISFNRLDLSIVRQKMFDEKNNIVSDTRYSKWQPYNGVMFPAHIDINRVNDGYGVTMTITDMQMNLPLTDDKFVLTQPDGSTLRTVGAKTGTR